MHYNLHLAVKQGFDNGFGGQAWTSLKMTNDGLKAGIYTVVFEIFTRSAVSPPILSDETLTTEVYGDGNYNVITFFHDNINNQYTKALFSSVVMVNLVKLPFRFDIMVAVSTIIYCLHLFKSDSR